MQLSPHFARRVSALALASAICSPAIAQDQADSGTGQAQEPASPEPDVTDGSTIVVTAQRQRGSVDTDVPPILELDAADVAAYGADSIADLVAQLTPQVGSGSGRASGRPVILVNGQRIGSFRELRGYPPEAIEKVEVLPEEVALQFGFSAEQRVINFILKDNYKSREVEIEYGGPTRGGTANGELEVSQLSISGPRRLNIGAEFNTQSMLTEDERDIVQTAGSQPTVATDPDPAAFRSLRADSESYQLEATLNSSLGEGPSAPAFSLNGTVNHSDTRSFSGLDTVILTGPGGATAIRTLDADPITRITRTTTYAGSGSYRQPIGDFQFDATLDAVYVDSESEIDRRRDTSALQAQAAAGTLAVDGVLPAVASAGVDRALTDTYTVNSLATLRGSILMLPAGEARMTANAGYNWNRIESEDSRTALSSVQLTRGRINAGAGLILPITSRREGFLEALGDITLNIDAGLEHLSDFGTLLDLTTGLTWGLTERLTLSATYTTRESAPSLTNLGAPVVVDFNVPVFDFSRNESVLANITSGGNPFLQAENQRDWKLAANYELDLFERANLLVEYYSNSSDNTTEGFPLLTPEIEAAFPDRVTRDAGGRLVALDRRSVTFAERNSSRIRYGFNMFGRVGKAPAEDEGSRGGGMRGGGDGPPAGRRAGGSQGNGPQGGGQARMGREQFQQMREQFCASEPGTIPDISGLPEQFQQRLRGPDGQVDPERIAALRQRFCQTDGGDGAGGPGQFRFDPEQIAAIRQTLCDGAEEGTVPDISSLPERMQARLRNEDGTVNQERLAQLRQGICSAEEEGSGDNAEGRNGGDGERRGRRGGGRRGGGGGPFGGGDGQGRWFLSLYHTVQLENEALIAPGLPVLDLLDGDSLGGAGGSPRHVVELEGGVFHEGFGSRLSGRYRSATRVDGSGLPGSTDLFFGDLVTFDLRLFANLEQQEWLTGDNPGFWKGARLSLRVDNIFDTRQRVTDNTGTVPLSYQPFLIDPLGRTIEVEFRKLF